MLIFGRGTCLAARREEQDAGEHDIRAANKEGPPSGSLKMKTGPQNRPLEVKSVPHTSASEPFLAKINTPRTLEDLET